MRVLVFCVAALLTTSAWASDCGISKKFRTNGTQMLAGTLADETDRAIPGLRLELLRDKSVFSKARTNNEGRFDLGQVPAGTYRLRVVSPPFCAPQIDCKETTCSVSGKLRLKSNVIEVQ